jgi:alkylhydroperoxidase family enzyme
MTQETTVDITPAEDRDLPPDVLARLQSVPPISINRLLAIVPQSLIPWTDLIGAIYDCELEDRLREIAICRQGRSARAQYELYQHRQIARNNGVSDAELTAVLSEPVVTSLDDHANLVCQVADELETTATLSDGTQEALYAALGRRQATELILTVSMYCAVARFTNGTRAPIEADNPLATASNPNVR